MKRKIIVCLLLSICFFNRYNLVEAKNENASWNKIKKNADVVLKDPKCKKKASANYFAIYFGKKGIVYYHLGNGVNYTLKVASGNITKASIKKDKVLIYFKKEIKIREAFKHISYKTTFNDSEVSLTGKKLTFSCKGTKELSVDAVSRIYYKNANGNINIVTSKPSSIDDPYGLRWVSFYSPKGREYKYSMKHNRYK